MFRLFSSFALTCVLTLLPWQTPPRSVSASILTGEFNWIHDPSRAIECDGKFYVFYTGKNIPVRVSDDLTHWKNAPAVLPRVPNWARKAVPAAEDDFVWAPDAVFWRGKYHLFYSFSTFGSITSVIGHLTNTTLDATKLNHDWKDEGLVVASKEGSDFNAIDPAPIIDGNGDLFLTLGSWHRGGIKVVKLDEQGKIDGQLKTIAARQPSGPEAPYLHFKDGYFTLFENEGTCCQGMNSGYQVMMGRSKSIWGPYLDKAGRDLAQGGGSLLMEADGDEIGPGHIGIVTQNGLDYATYHFYNAAQNGVPTLGMKSLWWDAQGWPHAGHELPAGRYVITSKASGLALGVHNNESKDGTPIDQFSYRGGATQGWNVARTGDGFYSIRSMGTNKFFDRFECGTGDNTKVNLYPWYGNDCQKWRIDQNGENTYRVTAKGAETALTLPGGAQTPQLQILASHWKGDDSQRWVFQPLP